jgi:fructose-1,6-bisphosphatase/inositol monophosphatase family enzyme
MRVEYDGSAAILHVACGRFDAYWRNYTHPWDIAGGIVIAEEAGGRESFQVKRYDGNWHLIAACNYTCIISGYHQTFSSLVDGDIFRSNYN